MEEQNDNLDLEKSLSVIGSNNNVPLQNLEESDDYGVILYENTLQHLLSGIDYSVELPEPELSEEEQLAMFAHPLLLEDRYKALTLLNELILSAEAFNEIITADLKGPVCPYQKTLDQYLGVDFKCPSITDIILPPTFSLPAIKNQITQFQIKTETKMLDHLEIMTKEAADTTFPGITSENLGNAFAILSGNKYVIDKAKLSQHLEFGEIIRNLPQKYIEEQPYLTAFRVLARYSEIAD